MANHPNRGFRGVSRPAEGRRYLVYSAASADILWTGDDAEEIKRSAAEKLCEGDDQFLVVFDCGDKADWIARPLNAHRVMNNLKLYAKPVFVGKNVQAARVAALFAA